MNRLQWIFLVVILAELGLGGWLISQRLIQSPPPTPDLALVDEALASDLRRLSASCRGAVDWRPLAEAYLIAGYFPEAEACYRHAVTLKPSDAEGIFEWAFCLSRL